MYTIVLCDETTDDEVGFSVTDEEFMHKDFQSMLKFLCSKGVNVYMGIEKEGD